MQSSTSSESSKMENYLMMIAEMDRKKEDARLEERKLDRMEADRIRQEEREQRLQQEKESRERWEREMEITKLRMEQNQQMMLMFLGKFKTD